MKKLLVVVDMQNDFITGSLGTKEAVAIVSQVVSKIQTYRKMENEVVYTRDTHFEDYMATQEGKKLPVTHCIKGTWGWELNESVAHTVTKESRIFDKYTFGSKELAEYIKKLTDKEQGSLEVELVGLCTDICIVSNALLIKAYCPELSLIVDANCCAGVTPSTHESALTTMTMCQIHVANGEK